MKESTKETGLELSTTDDSDEQDEEYNDNWMQVDDDDDEDDDEEETDDDSEDEVVDDDEGEGDEEGREPKSDSKLVVAAAPAASAEILIFLTGIKRHKTGRDRVGWDHLEVEPTQPLMVSPHSSIQELKLKIIEELMTVPVSTDQFSLKTTAKYLGSDKVATRSLADYGVHFHTTLEVVYHFTSFQPLHSTPVSLRALKVCVKHLIAECKQSLGHRLIWNPTLTHSEKLLQQVYAGVTADEGPRALIISWEEALANDVLQVGSVWGQLHSWLRDFEQRAQEDERKDFFERNLPHLQKLLFRLGESELRRRSDWRLVRLRWTHSPRSLKSSHPPSPAWAQSPGRSSGLGSRTKGPTAQQQPRNAAGVITGCKFAGERDGGTGGKAERRKTWGMGDTNAADLGTYLAGGTMGGPPMERNGDAHSDQSTAPQQPGAKAEAGVRAALSTLLEQKLGKREARQRLSLLWEIYDDIGFYQWQRPMKGGGESTDELQRRAYANGYSSVGEDGAEKARAGAQKSESGVAVEAGESEAGESDWRSFSSEDMLLVLLAQRHRAYASNPYTHSRAQPEVLPGTMEEQWKQARCRSWEEQYRSQQGLAFTTSVPMRSTGLPGGSEREEGGHDANEDGTDLEPARHDQLPPPVKHVTQYTSLPLDADELMQQLDLREEADKAETKAGGGRGLEAVVEEGGADEEGCTKPAVAEDVRKALCSLVDGLNQAAEDQWGGAKKAQFFAARLNLLIPYASAGYRWASFEDGVGSMKLARRRRRKGSSTSAIGIGVSGSLASGAGDGAKREAPAVDGETDEDAAQRRQLDKQREREQREIRRQRWKQKKAEETKGGTKEDTQEEKGEKSESREQGQDRRSGRQPRKKRTPEKNGGTAESTEGEKEGEGGKEEGGKRAMVQLAAAGAGAGRSPEQAAVAAALFTVPAPTRDGGRRGAVMVALPARQPRKKNVGVTSPSPSSSSQSLSPPLSSPPPPSSAVSPSVASLTSGTAIATSPPPAPISSSNTPAAPAATITPPARFPSLQAAATSWLDHTSFAPGWTLIRLRAPPPKFDQPSSVSRSRQRVGPASGAAGAPRALTDSQLLKLVESKRQIDKELGVGSSGAAEDTDDGIIGGGNLFASGGSSGSYSGEANDETTAGATFTEDDALLEMASALVFVQAGAGGSSASSNSRSGDGLRKARGQNSSCSRTSRMKTARSTEGVPPAVSTDSTLQLEAQVT
jgi:hypothetical protein